MKLFSVILLANILIVMIVLGSCATIKLPLLATENPIPTMSDPDPLPTWLREVRPSPASYITQNEYGKILGSKYMQEGPPPPPVAETGFRSSICVDIDVETLVEPGDLLYWDADVHQRVELIIDGVRLEERAETDYLAVIEPPPSCECFYDCDASSENWSFTYDTAHTAPPSNTGCWFWPGFWYCYPLELELGEHTATCNFTKTSGVIESYTWHFVITE
jgi:hypothetical protein